jgi:GGDEF domain-containing protein
MHSGMKSAHKPAIATSTGPAWLSVAAMLADLAFETDAMGRFTALAPGRALGQPTQKLLGVEAASLLARGPIAADSLTVVQFRSVFTTICTECVAWHGRVRLNQADGSTALFRLALAPRISGSQVVGTFGLLFDLEAAEMELPEAYQGPGDPGLRRNAMLDAETGLWSARTFAEEISRRFDRLDVEDKPGCLLYLGFSRAVPQLYAPIAMRIAEELRDIVRPTDLLGRVDRTTIALWCDGMDHLTAGERAAKFCGQFPNILPERAIVTAGVAPRWPGTGDDPATVIERAAVALRLADIATERSTEPTGAWRVWQRD